MQCRDIQQLLPVRRELTWTQEQSVQAHLRDCAACSAAARRVDRTQRALGALTAEGTRSAAPPARVNAAIQARLGRADGRPWIGRLAISGVLLAIVLLAALLGRDPIIAQVRTLGLDLGAAPSPPMQLYMSDPSGQLAPADPETLEYIEGAAPLTLDIPVDLGVTLPIVSDDYSTIAVIGGAPTSPSNPRRMIWMLDARTRALRNEFSLSETSRVIYLSGDGTRMAVHCNEAACNGWEIFDTSSGQQLSTIPHNPPFYRAWLDQTGEHLYTLRLSCEEDCDAPGVTTLLRYNTATGALAGQVDLRDVMADIPKFGGSAGNEDVTGFVFPGLALSPDGQQFAILHADLPVLTLVDTATMTVVSTRPLSGKAAWPDQGVLHPDGQGGLELNMLFSPDGRLLYVFGTERGADAAGKVAEHRKGLRVIDVERAEVVGDVLVGQPVNLAAMQPDGSALYLTVHENKPSYASSLYRIDSRTLAITAERTELPLQPQAGVLMLPAGTSP